MFQFLRKSRSISPAAPAGERLYAIGDIHGRLDCLNDLLNRIDADTTGYGGRVKLILLGDLVNRGPDSRGVLERLLSLNAASDDVTVLMGNHEEILLLAIAGQRDAVSLFARIGGRSTALSYGITTEEFDHATLGELADMLATAIPQEHVDFLSSLADRLAIGDYRFVHAGLRPGVAWDEQDGSDLRWIRQPFLESTRAFDGMVVHGHTVSDAPDERSNRIGIDTGAWASGRLTALALEGDRRWILQTALSPAE